jgi:metal-sulfur cluster biosynthetic enzyme
MRTTAAVDPADVTEALRAVYDPCSVNAGAAIDIVDMGLVTSVTVEDGHVAITLRPTTPMCLVIGPFVEAADAAAGAVVGVETVEVRLDMTPDWTEDHMAPSARARLTERRQASLAEVPVRPRRWRESNGGS